MSLIAWYQLNGDLTNKGIDDNDLINSNSTIIVENETGKIGKCYEDLVTSYAYLESENPILLPQTHSMFCWIYPEKLGRSANLDGVLGNHIYTDSDPSNTGITLRTFDDNTYSVSLNTANIQGQRTFNTYYGKTILKINEWHHIGFTYDGKVIKLYVDGKVDKEVQYKNMKLTSQKLRVFSWSTVYTDTTYKGKKKINDVRIYDECLSPLEVKKIYQTCILHYNFEDVVVPYTNDKYNYTNIAKYANQIEGIAPEGTLTKLDETFEGSPIFRLSMTATTEAQLNDFKTILYNHGIYISKFDINAGQTKTFAILYRNITNKDTIVGGRACNKFTSVDLGSSLYKDNWYRTAQKRTNNTTESGYDNWFVSFKCPSAELNKEIIIDFCCIEEYADIDFLPERISYEKKADKTIYDSSGYGHDGLLSGGQYNAIFKTNNIEGNHCLEFIGDAACYIDSGKIFYDNINQCHTVTAWVFRTDNETGNQELINWNYGYRIKFGQGNTTNNERTILYINAGSNDCYTYGKALPLNEWHHIAYVFDRNNNIKNIYIDGKLSNDVNTGDASKLTPYLINKSTYFGVRFKGYLDDIRIYATALTQEEILDLYKNRAKVNKNSKLFTNNIQEKSKFDQYNLIYNGMLELENADGFNNAQYTTEDNFRGSKGCLIATDSISTKYMIPICNTDTYKMEFDIKFNSDLSGNKYYSLMPYDQYKNHIDITSINKYANTDTTLAKPLNNGDTTVTLTDASNWYAGNSSPTPYIGICDYPEFGTERARLFKAYNSIENNILTLQSAWAGGNIPAGTKVANFRPRNVEFYLGSVTPSTAPKEWKHYEYIFKGNNIRKFTNYIKFAVIWGSEYKICNMKLTNLTSPQTIESVYGQDITNLSKNYSFNSNQFSECMMPIRYIRDWCGGSNVNTSAHWVEIQAFNSTNQNIALGKSVTISATSQGQSITRVTDGDLTSSNYLGINQASSDPKYVQIDLGFIENIEKIVIFHYYQDKRTYANTKTEVSSDGKTWYTIFDSNIEGTYPETSTGHTIYMNINKFFINKNGKTYTNNIIEI